MALIDEVIERQRRDDLENAFEDLTAKADDLCDLARTLDGEDVDLQGAEADVRAAVELVRVRLAQVLEPSS